MTTARDVMNRGAQCITPEQTLTEAARLMKDLGIGSLPVQDSDGALVGMVTDLDTVVRCVADGADPARTTAGSVSAGTVVTVEADDDIDAVVAAMRRHQVKRMPVLSAGKVVGMISESDLVAELDEERITHFAEGVYSKD